MEDHSKPPFQLCDEESSLHGQFSKMYFAHLTTFPWRTQLISGALPLNLFLRPLVTSLAGTRRTELQALVWPHILQQTNVVFVENPLYSPEFPLARENAMDSAFVVPMLLRIAESCGKRHINHLTSDGPLAIVVCLTVEESLQLIESIKVASQQFDRSFRVVNIFESPNDKGFQEKAYTAAESCDVLIVALHSIMSLFTTQGRLYQSPINLLKTELVIFRNVDVMMKLDGELVEQTIGRFQHNCETNFVLAAASASQAVKKLADGFKTSNFLFITNYIDAILYERLPIQLLDLLHDKRLPRMLQVLKAIEGRVPGEKVVIHVANDKEAVAFSTALLMDLPKQKTTVTYDCQSVKEIDPVYETNVRVREWWRTDLRDQIRLLIIPDAYAGDFMIVDADLVVHLSVPSSLQKLLARFTCIKKAFMSWTSVYSAIAKGQEDRVALPRMPCCFAIDDQWRNLLPLLVRVASASSDHSMVPPSIADLAEKVLRTPRLLQIPICSQLLYYGDCIYRGCCGRRHYAGDKSAIVSEISVPNTTKIEFAVMRMINPSHSAIRILRSVRAGGKTVSFVERQSELNGKLNDLAKDLPEPCSNVPAVGVVCGMTTSNSTRIHRVTVIKQLDENFIHVRYIDEAVGSASMPEDYKHPKFPAKVKIAAVRFYPLSDYLQTFPKTWTNLIISQILPSHHERQWKSSASTAVYAAMKSFIADKATMETRGVSFACEDYVFVDNMRSLKIQDGRSVCAFDMRNILKRFTHVTPNTAHLENLKNRLDEKLSGPHNSPSAVASQNAVLSPSSSVVTDKTKNYPKKELQAAANAERGDYLVMN